MKIALIGLLLAVTGPAAADNLIRAHGKYSEAYQSDWSALPTGCELARHDPGEFGFQEVAGEQARQSFVDQDEVLVSGKRHMVSWAQPECDKYKHSLYYFRNCKLVRIEDMAVIQADTDFRASSTFFFEDCDRVEIRDCYLAGTCGRAFIRLEGSREYFIDRVEIAGLRGEDGRFRAGPGIFINNGAGWDEARGRPGSLWSPDPANLEWGVIQNSYFHEYGLTDPIHNHDAILFHAPADGIVFNCYFENWEADSALDDSHRRNDAGYQHHVHRIERNVFRNCHRVKTNGAVGSPTCALVWANNLYVDSSLTDYHTDWDNWHLHETFVYGEFRPSYFLVMHCRQGATPFRNCLLYAPATVKYVYETMGDTPNQDLAMIRPDYFMYLMPAPVAWLHPRTANNVQIDTWEQWRATGADANSTFRDAPPGFADAESFDYRLRADSPAAGAGSRETLMAAGLRPAITRDFLGTPRPDLPSCGAFEVVQE